MTSLSNVKRAMSGVQKRIDNRTELYPPLDYSFQSAHRIEGRSFERLWIEALDDLSIDAIFTEPRAASETSEPVKEGNRYYSYALNFNHNMLTGPLESLPSLVRMILVQPEALSTLDLSFNMFTEIPAVSLRRRSSPHH